MVAAKYQLKLDVDETIVLGEELVADPPVKHTIAGDNGTLDTSSGIPVTKVWSDTVQLTAGTVTLDLTALVRPNLANIDFTGLKVQLVKIKADTANTAVIIVKPAVSNGYFLLGDTDAQWTGAALDQLLQQTNDTLPDVAGGAKDITITSSDADAKFDIILAAG